MIAGSQLHSHNHQKHTPSTPFGLAADPTEGGKRERRLGAQLERWLTSSTLFPPPTTLGFSTLLPLPPLFKVSRLDLWPARLDELGYYARGYKQGEEVEQAKLKWVFLKWKSETIMCIMKLRKKVGEDKWENLHGACAWNYIQSKSFMLLFVATSLFALASFHCNNLF